MKIALAQLRSTPGDLARNRAAHLAYIQAAAAAEANAIFFPELSLTGYEPQLAEALASRSDDPSWAIFQTMAEEQEISIGLGLPLRQDHGITISMLIFRPGEAPKHYDKQFLHADEEPYFSSGHHQKTIIGLNQRVAPAICYEISVPAHLEQALTQDAAIYLASVAKTAEGMTAAYQRLAAIAKQHQMPVLIVNAVGPCDDFIASGGSAAWDTSGNRLAQLGEEEGLLIIDTTTNDSQIITVDVI